MLDSAALYRFLGLSAAFVSLLFIAAESGDAPPPVPEPILMASPALTRIDLAASEERTFTITLTSPVAARLIAITTDCRCVSALSPTPMDLAAGKPVQIAMRTVGVLPGVKTVTFRTSEGSTRAQVQVVTTGMGTGAEILKTAIARARTLKATAWFIIHDLRGEIRNCGCSTGSLGGIDHLAALPAHVADIDASVLTRFILSGESDGTRAGVGAALVKHGWAAGDPAVVVSARPDEALVTPGVIAVIPSAPIAIEHARLLRPLLTGGMLAEVLLVSGDGRIVERHSLPIDATLPSRPEILAEFQEPLTSVIDDQTQPNQACATCHSSAHKSWSTSAHARAWASLKETDRTDGCVACHSLPNSPDPAKKVIVPNVHCASCHRGAAEHAASAGTVKTKGTTDCRSCHDARHDPGFNPIAAWAKIAHGK